MKDSQQAVQTGLIWLSVIGECLALLCNVTLWRADHCIWRTGPCVVMQDYTVCG